MSHNKVLEREAEADIISSLTYNGLSAFHMDSTVDGFCDTIVFGGRVVLIEHKFSRRGLTDKLCNIMEPTQPVFLERIQRSGYKDAILCVFDGESYSLYDVDDILHLSMVGGSLKDLPLLASHFTSTQVADYVKELCDGC